MMAQYDEGSAPSDVTSQEAEGEAHGWLISRSLRASTFGCCECCSAFSCDVVLGKKMAIGDVIWCVSAAGLR